MHNPQHALVVLIGASLAVAACDRTALPTTATPVAPVVSGVDSSMSAGVVAGLSASSSTSVSQIPASFGFTPSTQAAIQACVGEALAFTGDAVLVVHWTTLPNSSGVVVVHGNPQGAVAVGTSSGATYRLAASDTLTSFIAPPGTFVDTFTANLWVIGPGGRPRFGGPILLHLTVSATGDVTAHIEMLDKGFQCVSATGIG